MSVHKLKDGRWIVKYPDPEKASGSKREYFGRGAAAEIRARNRDRELDLKQTKPWVLDDAGLLFQELALELKAGRSDHLARNQEHHPSHPAVSKI